MKTTAKQIYSFIVASYALGLYQSVVMTRLVREDSTDDWGFITFYCTNCGGVMIRFDDDSMTYMLDSDMNIVPMVYVENFEPMQFEDIERVSSIISNA